MEYWSCSFTADHEFEKLVLRINPPRVAVDNVSAKKRTLIKVDSINKRGNLFELVQVLTDLNLIIQRAYISSDGDWFMDVFLVTDCSGNKVVEDNISERIQQEKTGQDYSEIFDVFTDLKCNIVAAAVWTHNSRMASVVYITDEVGFAIDDPYRLAKIKRLLLYVLKGHIAVSVGSTHRDRRLHQMMYADTDYDIYETRDITSYQSKLVVLVENYADKGYTVVNLRCLDRPKLLFDTICMFTEMEYVVYHCTIIAEGPEAYQEYYIRHYDGCPICSEAERQRVINCLEAAIKRRTSEGLRLELCSEDRVGLLSNVTRIFRENGLSVSRAEVTTRGSQALNVFYVIDASGCEVKAETIDAVRKEIGLTILKVKDDVSSTSSNSTQQQTCRSSTLGDLLWSRSEKFLYFLGLIMNPWSSNVY